MGPCPGRSIARVPVISLCVRVPGCPCARGLLVCPCARLPVCLWIPRVPVCPWIGRVPVCPCARRAVRRPISRGLQHECFYKNILTKKSKVSGALTMFGTEYVAHNRLGTFIPFSFFFPNTFGCIPNTLDCKLIFLQSEKEARLEQFPTRNS